MALKIGNNAVANAFVGSSQVRRAYKGGTLVYQGFGPASEQEFIEQTAAGGPAQLLKVYGKSVVFRQLRRDTAATYTADGITTSYDADTGLVCVHNNSRTSPYMSGSSQIYLTDATFPALVGHKIAILFSVQDSSIGVTNPSGIYLGSTIMTLTNAMLRLRIDASYDFINAHPVGSDYYFYVNFIDLTDYFGAGNEPTTIAEVRKYFPADYYPYDPGSLQSNKTAELRAYDGGNLRGSLSLNLSTLTGKLNGEGASVVVYPDGLRGVGTDRDAAYGSTGVVRFGKRAYQAGDESDTSVLTDGTNTIYPLATPLTYTLDAPLPTDLTCEQGDILQRVSDNNCPFVGEMKFGL